jgi:hypothetical protein
MNANLTSREPHIGYLRRLSNRESGNARPRVHTSVSMSSCARQHSLTDFMPSRLPKAQRAVIRQLWAYASPRVSHREQIANKGRESTALAVFRIAGSLAGDSREGTWPRRCGSRSRPRRNSARFGAPTSDQRNRSTQVATGRDDKAHARLARAGALHHHVRQRCDSLSEPLGRDAFLPAKVLSERPLLRGAAREDAAFSESARRPQRAGHRECPCSSSSPAAADLSIHEPGTSDRNM